MGERYEERYCKCRARLARRSGGRRDRLFLSFNAMNLKRFQGVVGGVLWRRECNNLKPFEVCYVARTFVLRPCGRRRNARGRVGAGQGTGAAAAGRTGAGRFYSRRDRRREQRVRSGPFGTTRSGRPRGRPVRDGPCLARPVDDACSRLCRCARLVRASAPATHTGCGAPAVSRGRRPAGPTACVADRRRRSPRARQAVASPAAGNGSA